MQDKRRKLSLSDHYQGNIHFNSTNIDRTEGVIFLERHDLPSTKESIRVAGVGWLSCTAAESLRAFVEHVFANFRDKNIVFWDCGKTGKRSGSYTKGRTPNIRYFVAKLSIVAIYMFFERLSQGFQRKPSCFRELSTKAILLS